MRTNKIISKVLSLSALTLAITSTAACVSCSEKKELFFTVKGKDLDVTFCDKGASIYSIKYKKDFITYHPKDKNVFLQDDNYYGKTLGRVAGRIKDGKLKVGDKDYQLEVNEVKHEDKTQKNNSLHGGTHGLGTKIFTHSIAESKDWYTVSFNYVSPAGEAGYPEKLESSFVYTIYKEKNVIDLYITATTSGPTPVNLSTHPFFRLGDKNSDIKGHILKIPASNMALYDNMQGDKSGGQIVEGDQPVAGTPWDFTNTKVIDDAMLKQALEADPVSGGIDHIWKFDPSDDGLHTLSLSSASKTLKVTTDADGVIMYANCFPKEGQLMNDGEEDKQFGAITIEPYKFFTKDTVDDLILDKDQKFTRYISYEIS